MSRYPKKGHTMASRLAGAQARRADRFLLDIRRSDNPRKSDRFLVDSQRSELVDGTCTRVSIYTVFLHDSRRALRMASAHLKCETAIDDGSDQMGKDQPLK
ncbi:hypothetical protein NL676_031356 [Syzygium grande]|nr:hypothetical protein NL676_031356 [Syzygium grande]